MEAQQLDIDFKCSVILRITEHLKESNIDSKLLQTIISLDDIEKNRIANVLNRIKEKGGCMNHFIRYLRLVHS